MGDHHHGPAKGLSRWLFTTNHKDIGTMYLWFSFSMFILGGAFAMIIRAELFQPGMQLVEPAFFNQMTTLHGLVMVFGAIMPSFVGLANWMIPMMIGAPDMALPRMNNWSFWILPPAFLILAGTLFMEGGAPNFGWTFYAPLSTTYAPPSVTYFIFSIHVLGLSSIMGSINIIALKPRSSLCPVQPSTRILVHYLPSYSDILPKGKKKYKYKGHKKKNEWNGLTTRTRVKQFMIPV